VAGGLGLVVGLGLDNHAGTLTVGEHTANEIPGYLEHGPGIERGPHASDVRARCSCSRTRLRLVPPSDTLDSSQAPSWSTP